MRYKLYKKDCIELHERIIKELVLDSNGEQILNFDRFFRNCCLVFDSFDNPERMIYDKNLYHLAYKQELEIKNALEQHSKPSRRRDTTVEEERIERHDAASYGDGLAMGAVGITSPNQIH